MNVPRQSHAMDRCIDIISAKGRGEKGMSQRQEDVASPPISTLAFTLLELLIVIAIIGLLLGLSLPHLKGMRQSNVMASANRQLLDDLALARHRAISGRTTVYVIFVPPAESYWMNPAIEPRLTGVQKTNVLLGQFNSYVMFSRRQIGEQPGRENPRFLSPLKSLPDGIFIQEEKFNLRNLAWRFETNLFPLPTVTNENVNALLPYIAFDFQGRLITARGEETIPLARGSIIHQRGPTGLDWLPAEARERPPLNSIANSNHIVIDGLTGRATVVRPEIK